MRPAGPRQLLNGFLRLGADSCDDPRLFRNIQLTNQIAAGLAVLCLGYVLAQAAWRPGSFSWPGLALGAAYASIPWINGIGGLRASRLLLIALTNASIALAALRLGHGTGIRLFFLPLAWISLMLFAWEERKSIAFGMLLSSGLLLAFEGLSPGLDEAHYPSDPHLHRWHFCALVTMLLCQILVVAYFLIANRRTESDLITAGAAALAADKSKSQFLANMSHEIRTPLNGILGMSSLLLKAGLRPEPEDLIHVIQSSGTDLMDITSEILDLSRIEAGKLRIDKAPFEIRPMVEAVIRPFRREARRKGLRLESELDGALPAALEGDALRIRQVLNQLLGNALKFTERGAVTLKVRPIQVTLAGGDPQAGSAAPGRVIGAGGGGGTMDADPVCVEFQVEDTGPGIPIGEQARIFQGYPDAVEPQGRRQAGTGLGLYIARQIAEMMEGAIGFRSEPGKGSVFSFRIPLRIAAAPVPEAPAAAAPRAEPVPHRTLEILIVEDHPLNQKVMAGFLAPYNYRIRPVYSGQEALTAFAEKPFDLVFMDCHMPGMDGYECTRRLRESAPPERRPVIIGVTADAMVGTRERCLQAGMDDVVTKPILSKELDRVLAQWVAPRAIPERAAEATAEAGSAWVDVRHLHEMDEWIRTYDPEFWERALKQFLESLERLAGAMRREADAGNFTQAGESAHALKGLCLMLGLSRMGEACKGLESLFARERAGDWRQALEELSGLTQPSLQELRKRVGAA